MDVHALNHAIKTYTKHHSDNIYWPIPQEINFLQIKDADDVATITCKVGNITIRDVPYYITQCYITYITCYITYITCYITYITVI